MSQDSLTTCPREVTWQFKSLISLIPQSLLPPNLTGSWIILSGNYSWCHMTLWPRGHVRLRDRLKILYLLFQKVYDHETLQGSHLWQGKITYIETWRAMLNKGSKVGAIIMDVSKEFDTLKHNLFCKSKAYSFNNNALTFIQCYFTNRH